MKIFENVTIKGATGERTLDALIDTGAERSMIPFSIAVEIGAWRTNQQVTLVSVFKEKRNCPLVAIYIYFPSLNNQGGQIYFALDDIGSEIILGMDILNTMGITIDTKTHKLSIRNDIWESFKTLATAGVLVFAGIKLLDHLQE